MSPRLRSLGRLVTLLALSVLALQLYFLLRIAAMLLIDPQSSSFQRSEAWRLLTERHLAWSQQWASYDRIAPTLKRAVIASEDAGFTDHGGIEWEALERAWQRNVNAEARAAQINQAPRRGTRARKPAVPKVVGGSTITQQLAKNLFLGPERHLLRKGQELVITLMLEALLSKQRILEIYLNEVEWGAGVFGAEAAARHYFRTDARSLGPAQAARLAVMLPAPKRFEQHPASAYLTTRAATIAARMDDVDLP